MSLLDKASILITPTAYDVGSINAIKPIQTISGELVTNGDFSNGSTGWTLGTQWSIVNNEAVYVGDGTNNTLIYNVTLIQGKTYRVKFNVLSISGVGKVQMQTGIDNDFNTVGEKTFDVSITNDPFSGIQFARKNGVVSMTIDDISLKEVLDADLDFTRATSGSVVGTANRENADGELEEVAENVSRIDYLGGVGHWLIEPQATNTATDSNDFTVGTLFNGGNSAGLDDAVLTSAQATSPDGNNNAWKLADNNDDGTGVVKLRYYGTNVTSANYNVVSLFVKKQGNNDWFQIAAAEFDIASANAFFNISNGTLGTITNFTDANIENYGDGWYRISATFATTTDTQGAIQFRLAAADQNVNITRNGTNGAYIYGIQAETSTNANATKPTSYIPTSNGQVTRAEDGFGLNTTLDTSLINSTEGTFYSEMAALDNNLVDRNISLSDGDDNNTIRFRYTTASNGLQVTVKVGTSQAAFTTTSFDITNFLKIGLRFKENDFACFVNGSQVGTTDTNGSTFPANTLDKIKSTRGDSAFDFAGKIKCIAVFKEGLTDSELTCLTT